MTILSLLLYAISICETSCGQYDVQNTSAETQKIIVQEENGPVKSSQDIAAGQTVTLQLTAGKYVITTLPEQKYYRVSVLKECGDFNICPLGLPANIEYVDMGLPSGTYWANMNLGATEPYECGCYFAYGETEPKETFTWENYKWVLSATDHTTTKYNYNASWGTPVDGKMHLDPEDDAAHVHWGDGWWIPEVEDINELIANVTFSVETRNGQKGMKVVSKINGNELFFPFAGYKTTYLYGYNSDGEYQSSELRNDIFGYYHPKLQTYDYPSIRFRTAGYQRGNHHNGCSVRPVFKGTPPTPPESPVAQLPVLSGAFSVSDTKKVLFAPGNLQYKASTGTWRFAEHQYDYVGSNNMNISQTYDGWIDLFGWTTSGYNGHYPWLSSANNDLYYSSTDIDGTEYDWGVHNAISNGGNTSGQWRTMSVYELEYLLNSRAHADELRGAAIINGIKGRVLLPDDWVLPAGLTFLHDPTDWNTTNVNVYTAEQWKQMEEAGAVFLPAAGCRDLSFGSMYMSETNKTGFYWTSSYGSPNASRRFMVMNDEVHYGSWGNQNNMGMSVRLVKDTILPPPTPEQVSCPEYTSSELPVLSGAFSVSASRQVVFSPGNLQYRPCSNTFRFAEHQYDFVGNATNGNVYWEGDKCDNIVTKRGSSNAAEQEDAITYRGWIDLFCWATSGWHDPSDAGNTHYMPWDCNYDASSLTKGLGPSTNGIGLTGSYANYDWGVYNPIANGGNLAGRWSLLTISEWQYVFNTRTNAAQKRSSGRINTGNGYVNGFIILPDNWTLPAGCTFSANASNYNTNSYTSLQWQAMEQAGAVFLPAAGDASKWGSNGFNTYSRYWSSTANGQNASSVAMNASQEETYTKDRNFCHSVRLAKDIIE